MSAALVARELFTSPSRKPREIAKRPPVPFTFARVTVTRLASGTPVSVTSTSLPLATAAHDPIGAAVASTQVTVPVATIDALNWNTTLCPGPMPRGSTVTAPPIGCVASSARSKVPAAPWVLRDCACASASGARAEGVTETGADAAPVPAELVAVTAHEYVVAFARPFTVIGLVARLAVMPPGLQVAGYVTTDAPPLLAGGEKAITARPLPGVAEPMSGAPGTVGAITIDTLCVPLPP